MIHYHLIIYPFIYHKKLYMSSDQKLYMSLDQKLVPGKLATIKSFELNWES